MKPFISLNVRMLAATICIAGVISAHAAETPRLQVSPKQLQQVRPQAIEKMALPDLVVRTASIGLGQVCRPNNPVLLATVRVANIGKGASPAKTSVGVVQARDTDSGWGNGKGTPVIAPGKTVSVTVPIYYLQSDPAHMTGTHKFQIVLNSGKWFKESDYGNNRHGPIAVTVPKGFCKVPGKQPDITSKTGIRIGSKSAPWGGVITLTEADAHLESNGKCAFRVTYDMVNQGPVATSPVFLNKIHEDSAVVATNSNLSLAAGQSRNVTTVPYLTPGSHVVSLSLDDGGAVTESNEANNRFRVRVNLKGECRGDTAKLPDLVPMLSKLDNGVVAVKNIGTGSAGASKLVLNCRKISPTGAAAVDGGCPDIEMPAIYQDPAFPDRAVVRIPTLAPGANHSHTLSFWSGMQWDPGQYVITAIADGAKTVSESNEANNAVNRTLTK